jgi:twitching motility protein PilU
MEKSEGAGMRTFDSALYHLYKDGKITLEEALENADSKNNLRLKISLDEANVGNKGGADLTGGLSLVSKEKKQH